MLEQALLNAKKAVDEAHATATHSENVAENKYDTLGLEAAYLAHGQSMRVADCQLELDEFKRLYDKNHLAQEVEQESSHQAISLGSLVTLSFYDKNRMIFIGPGAAGLTVQVDHREIVVITPSSPLGQLLIGKNLYDEVELLIKGVNTQYEISRVY